MVYIELVLMMGYDKIIVLEEGKIADSGTHEELISKQGFYSSVYQQQMMQQN